MPANINSFKKYRLVNGSAMPRLKKNRLAKANDRLVKRSDNLVKASDRLGTIKYMLGMGSDRLV